MRQYLRDQAEAADVTIHMSPEFYKAELDGVKCEAIRQQNIGKYRGLSHLFYILDQRKKDLTARVNNKES